MVEHWWTGKVEGVGTGSRDKVGVDVLPASTLFIAYAHSPLYSEYCQLQ